jgi:hypothetical protein
MLILNIDLTTAPALWQPSDSHSDGDFCHQGRDTEIAQKNFKIFETYWHDHSLESSWGTLSDGEKMFFSDLFSNKPQSLKG